MPDRDEMIRAIDQVAVDMGAEEDERNALNKELGALNEAELRERFEAIAVPSPS